MSVLVDYLVTDCPHCCKQVSVSVDAQVCPLCDTAIPFDSSQISYSTGYSAIQLPECVIKHTPVPYECYATVDDEIDISNTVTMVTIRHSLRECILCVVMGKAVIDLNLDTILRTVLEYRNSDDPMPAWVSAFDNYMLKK